MVNHRDFNILYNQQVDMVYQHWSEEMQAKISRHNHAWRRGSTDFLGYLRASSIRFYRAYQFLKTGQSVCDIGGFWGVFPMTLKQLGFQVTMTEALQYYGGTFDPLFEQIADAGVTIVDYDPFDENALPPGQFDFISVMAVLEHYPHSLKPFMGNAVSMLSPTGRLYIEVPNIAFWPKRVSLLKGRTPLVGISEIYNSATPFLGHHHEFTRSELRDLVRLAGLKVVGETAYNYSPFGVKGWVRQPLRPLVCAVWKNCRECITVLCEKP